MLQAQTCGTPRCRGRHLHFLVGRLHDVRRSRYVVYLRGVSSGTLFITFHGKLGRTTLELLGFVDKQGCVNNWNGCGVGAQ